MQTAQANTNVTNRASGSAAMDVETTMTKTLQETDRKCPQCGGTLEFDPSTGGLKCPYCDYTEAIQHEEEAKESGTIDDEGRFVATEHAYTGKEDTATTDWGTATKTVICKSCGAEIMYDANAIANVCPYCGSTQVMEAGNQEEKIMAPGGVVTFDVDNKRAAELFKTWIGHKFFCPKLAKESAEPDKFHGVYVRHSVSIYDGFTLARVRVTSKDWIEDYEERYELARQAWKKQILDECGGSTDGQLFFDTYTSHAFEMPEGRPIEDTDVQDAKTAVYVISRVAGEGSDRHLAQGDYYLTDHELEDLRVLATLVEKIVIVINAGAPVDLTVLEAMPEVKAILFMGQAGEEGGNACARILLGFVNPSAKLTATWAKNYMDYPGAMDFSDVRAQLAEDNVSDRDALLARSRYEEGIYVGYRYFDSFGVEPRYHFGHGLSYTTFAITAEAPRAAADGLYIPVTVENSGNPYAGKDVVQVYAACPQPAAISGDAGAKAAATDETAETLAEAAVNGGTGVEASAQGTKVEAKEFKRLVAFRKTRLLAPGEQETMTLHVDGRALASFRTDYDAAHGAWVIEAGRYAIFVGDSSEESRLQLAGVVEVAEEKVL